MPEQILNMDDSGVTARPLEGKHKRVVFLADCQIAPSLCDVKDILCVLVAGRVCLAHPSLFPLQFTVSRASFHRSDLNLLRDGFATFHPERLCDNSSDEVPAAGHCRAAL
jgi:hypothetical protein